ncbi:probable polygalacturonase At3g15720 isoform X1 [Aristolochia californica]|uniref:probable polygalacturonase At3g15720 isoform X1 n=1 Tax=Aristolochia californica TaxID=171875 RepID=UPI0035E0F1DD
MQSSPMDIWNVFFLLISLVSLRFCRSEAGAFHVFDVTAYGAAGDAKTDDSNAFLKAWESTCGSVGVSSTFLIPSHKTFLLKPLTFSGECKASRIHIQIDGNLLAPGDRESFNGRKGWILIQNVQFLTVLGSGELDGRGSLWWPRECIQDPRHARPCDDTTYRPTLLTIDSCNYLTLKGWKLLNSPRNHLQLQSCNYVSISGISIYAPGETPNTDGINIFRSKHVVITDSRIASGDDCISFLSGVFDVRISSVACGPGHGISIGSLGKDNTEAFVSQILVEETSFTNTKNGVRIKTWQGGSGYVTDIEFRHIVMNSVENPIVIDQYYFDKTNKSSAVAVRNIDYFDIKGTGSKETVVSLACSLSVPCRNIRLNEVDLQTTVSEKKAAAYCLNVNGPPCPNCTPQIPCLGRM